MAKITYNATTGDDTWTVKTSTKSFSLDGLDGTDTLSFGKGKIGSLTVTQSGDQTIVSLVDIVSGASGSSSKLNFELQLKNVEKLSFDKGAIVIDLPTFSTVAIGTPTSGNDFLKGIDSADTLSGGEGKDTLISLGGDDSLSGGAGSDVLVGGDGADIFVFDSLKKGEYDSITDFTHGDFLEFDTTVFTQLVGATTDNLVFGAKAKDANDFLIYNSTNGKLYYDADGSGKGASIQIAGIKGTDASTLTIGDFHFV